MLGGEVVERQECVPVFDQLLGRFFIFDAIGFNEQVKSFFGVLSGVGLPDIMEFFLGFGVHRFRHGVQHIAGFYGPNSVGPLSPDRSR